MRSDGKQRLKVQLEHDPETNDWVASVNEPRRLVTSRMNQARGSDASQARNRLTKVVDEHFPEVYVFEEIVLPPAALSGELEEFQRDEQERERLEASIRRRRVPLAKKLAQYRVPQNRIAAMLNVTPTWLGQELKRDAMGARTAKRAKPGTRGGGV